MGATLLPVYEEWKRERERGRERERERERETQREKAKFGYANKVERFFPARLFRLHFHPESFALVSKLFSSLFVVV